MRPVKVGAIWVDLEDVLSRTDLTQLFGAGKRICPWHADTRPSLHIYPDHVYCYACGKHADAIAYVQMEMGVDFEGAVKYLLEHKLSTAVHNAVIVSPVDMEEVRAAHQALMDKSQRTVVWRWLTERGINEATVKSHVLGWTGRAYSIPHFSNGQVGNIKYRVHPDYIREGEAKYTSLPNRAFSHLYPWDYFRRVYGDATVVFITEGEFDCVLLLQAGLPALSTPSGAGTPWAHWVPFLKQFKTVFVLYDQDDAGNAASLRLHTDEGRIGKSVADLLLPTLVQRVTWDATLYGKDVTEARRFVLPRLLTMKGEGSE
jgi:DNA primase